MARSSRRPTGPPVFGHTAETHAFWRRTVRAAQKVGAVTPFFLFDPRAVAEGLTRMDALDLGRPAVQWFSTKTQPLLPLLEWWRRQGRPVEVVSEAEFRLVMAAGFDTASLLVNGPAKHRWLPAVSRPGLRVNFDSLRELNALLPLARRDRWQIGLRLCTSEEFDTEFPESPTQFGLTPDEAAMAVRRLHKAGLEVETLQFHLRTQVSSADCYARALADVVGFSDSAKLKPKHLDLGGGWPARHTLGRGGKRLDAGFSPESFALVVRQAVNRFPSVREVWLENGRYLTAGSGVLAVSVLDVKERRGVRQLICDGGRTLHALVSLWEQHALIPLPKRSGPTTLTACYGPTCMAFDQMARRELPRTLRVGDTLLWLDAGAYHLPWETRFSHGHAGIWWHEDGRMTPVRHRD